MSSPRVVDLSHARSAFKARDAEAFSRGIAPLRVDLTLEGLVRYVASVQDKDWGAFEIVEAVAIALREPSRFGFIHFIERISVLAVALEGHVVVAMQPSKKSQPFPKSGWQMGRWFKDPEKNRPTVEAWARDPARHKDALFVRFEAGASAADDRGEALLADVLARPDDDAPRLVYADWLAAQGDARGELVQVQCELATLPGRERERRRVLADRERDLLRGRATMLAPIAPFVEEVHFRRGLVEGVSMFPAKLEKHGEALLSAHPIRCITVIVNGPKEIDRVGKMAFLARVPELVLEARRTPKIHFARARLELFRLANSPIWGGPRDLRIEHADDTDEEWTTFFATLSAPSLERLTLRSVHFAPAVLARLASAPGLNALRGVDLDYPRMGQREHASAAVVEAIDALARKPLAHLGLSSFHLEEALLTSVFETLGRRTSLRSLRLSNTSMTRGSLGALGAFSSLEALELSNVTRWGITCSDLARACEQLGSLAELSIGEHEGAPAELDRFVDALLAMPRLKTLRWPRSPLSDAQVERLARRLEYFE